MFGLLGLILCLFGVGGLGYMWGKNKEQQSRRLKEVAGLLGPHAPEGGRTVIQRLRQAGFIVLERIVPPRAHMLGWLQVTPAPYSYLFVCSFCRSKIHEIREIAENPERPFPGALIVFNNLVCRVCNSCGVMIIEDSFLGDKRVGLCKLFEKAGANNLFDILDHLQSQSGNMDDKIAAWFHNRKQLLEREAAKIREVLIHRESGETEEARDGPYRDIALPEPSDVPKLLKKKRDS